MTATSASDRSDAARKAVTLAPDPQPWQHGYRGDGSEDRYSFTQGNKSTSFYMRWNPRPEYEQDMEKYGVSV